MISNTWVKSSRCSADQPQCVEVKHAISPGIDGVLVRSTALADDALFFTAEEWRVFVEGAKAGEFDLA
jgi:hypothetical protein